MLIFDQFNIIHHHPTQRCQELEQFYAFEKIKSLDLVLHEMILQEDWVRGAEKINPESSSIR